MSAALTVYKDSARTQPLAAGNAWGANQYADYGTVDITAAGGHASADIPLYFSDTGTTPISNVLAQAAPAALTTLAAAAAASLTITVASAANLDVGMALDIATPIPDPGVGAAYAYPLAPTYKAQDVVITAIAGTTITLSSAVTAASGDALYTAGTLAILGQVAVAPDAAGSPGVYGALGAETNVAAGPLTAGNVGAPSNCQAWLKATWQSADIEGTHKFAVRTRYTSG